MELLAAGLHGVVDQGPLAVCGRYQQQQAVAAVVAAAHAGWLLPACAAPPLFGPSGWHVQPQQLLTPHLLLPVLHFPLYPAAAVCGLAVPGQRVGLLQHIRQLWLPAQLAHDPSGAWGAKILQPGAGLVPAPDAQAPTGWVDRLSTPPAHCACARAFKLCVAELLHSSSGSSS